MRHPPLLPLPARCCLFPNRTCTLTVSPRGSVANDGTVFYFRTNKDAPQYKLVSVDISAPPEQRVFKELILITREGKPLPRTEKNTVMRKLALEVYNADIEKMYVSISNDADRDADPRALDCDKIPLVSRCFLGQPQKWTTPKRRSSTPLEGP